MFELYGIVLELLRIRMGRLARSLMMMCELT